MFTKVGICLVVSGIKGRIALENTILVLIVFVLTLLVSPYYIYGDQKHYRLIYEGLKGLNIPTGYLFYKSRIDSLEIIHFILVWTATNLNIAKDLFIAFLNALLAWSAIKLMRKIDVSSFIISIIICTNFYFSVLYFSGERLKIGFLFVLLSLLYKRGFYLFSLLSIFAHVQNIIIYASFLFSEIFKSIGAVVYQLVTKGTIRKLILFSTILIFVGSILVSYILADHIFSKFSFYNANSNHEWSEMIRISIFFGLALWYSNRKIETCLLFVPLFVTIYFVGGDRVNMIGYFFFLHYALKVNRGFNIGVMSTSLYYGYSTFNYITNILIYGNGFNL